MSYFQGTGRLPAGRDRLTTADSKRGERMRSSRPDFSLETASRRDRIGPLRRCNLRAIWGEQRMPARTLLWTGAVILAMATAAHAAMTISNAKTRNVSCTGGVCTPTGGNANLNTGELQTILASSDATVKSNAAAPDIGIVDPLTWASTHRLTLDAYESIHERAPVVVEGTSGLILVTNDGGTGGDYNFNTKTSGAITFWDTASSLVINGKSFTLVKDVKTLASAIAQHPSRSYALSGRYDA